MTIEDRRKPSGEWIKYKDVPPGEVIEVDKYYIGIVAQNASDENRHLVCLTNGRILTNVEPEDSVRLLSVRLVVEGSK